MRRLWVIVVGIFFALVLAFLLALRSESFVLAASHWAIANLTELRLELRNPRIDIYGGTLAADEIHLIPQGTEGPALVSMLDFSADFHLSVGGRSTSSIHAGQLLIYVSENEEAADPAPTQWLRYLNWLPTRISIAQVHLITASANTWIFPLKELQGNRQDNGDYQITAGADYEGEPLEIAVDVLNLIHSHQTIGATTRIRFTAPDSGSQITLDGNLEGTPEAFRYNLALDASYRDISEFLRGFEDSWNLAGELRLNGKMTGDIDGFVLSDARFMLDNKPDYTFDAAGELEYDILGDSRIELLATGELASLDHLLDWADLDVGALGSASINLRLSGSLDRPVIDEVTLVTRSEAGLTVTIDGQFDLFAPAPEVGSEARKMRVDMQGPSLQVLAAWLGDIPYDPGPWRASGQVSGSRQQLAVSDLELAVGTPGLIEIQASGAIGSIQPLTGDGRGYSASGIELLVAAHAPDSAEIAKQLEMELPPDLEVTANLLLTGSDQQLDISEGSVLIRGSELVATIAPLTAVVLPGTDQPLSSLAADVGLTVTNSSDLSAYTHRDIPALGPVRVSAKLIQKESTLQLQDVLATMGENDLKIRSRGRIANVAALSGVTLSNTVSGVSSNDLLAALVPDLQYDQPIGSVSGTFKLSNQSGPWQLSELSLSSGDDKSPLQLTVEGGVGDLSRLLTANLTAKFQATDAALLDALTGLPMKPVSGSLVMTTADQHFNTRVKAQVGATELNAEGRVAYQDGSVQSVQLALTTPELHLQDFGFTETADRDGDNQAGQNPQKSGLSLAPLRDKSPPYPVDVTVSVQGITGDNTAIDSLNIHLTGRDHRYTLEQFSMVYDQALAELRGIIDLNPQPPAMSLAVKAEAVPLSTLTRDLGVNMDISGSLTALGGLTVMGNSTNELVSSLNGSMAFALENAVIAGAAYDLLATDLLAWIYSGALTEKSTYLDCTMAKFQLNSGVATSHSLYIESEKMIATGKAEFDLVRQRMDLTITPMSKSRLLQLPSKIKLKGPMSDPKADISPLAQAADAASAALTLIPDLTMKLFGIDSSSGKNHRPCQAEPAD
jgi:hypothetical protein